MTNKTMIIKPVSELSTVDFYQPARYKFDFDKKQQAFIEKVYKMNPEMKMNMNVQFFQSANQLNGNSITINYVSTGGSFITQSFNLTGTFYSASELNDAILKLININIPVAGTIVWQVDETLLQNQNIICYSVKSFTAGLTQIQLIFNGYQIIQILGMDATDQLNQTGYDDLEVEVFNSPTHERVNKVLGEKPAFMPLVKQMQVCCSLQKNLVFCEDGVYRPIIADLVNSVLQNDWAAFQENFPLSPVKKEDLINTWYLDFYDQNWVEMQELKEMRVILTFGEKEEGLKIGGRILTNRGLL